MISSVLTQFCFQCFRPFDRFLVFVLFGRIACFLAKLEYFEAFLETFRRSLCCKTFFCLYFAEIIFEQFWTFSTGFSFCAVWPCWSILSEF